MVIFFTFQNSYYVIVLYHHTKNLKLVQIHRWNKGKRGKVVVRRREEGVGINAMNDKVVANMGG